MNRISLLVAALAVAPLANAATFDVSTSLDTFVNNASATNANRAYSGNTVANVNASNSAFFKFSAADLPANVVGGTLNSLKLTYSLSVVDPNTTFDIYFSSNADWLSGGNVGGVAFGGPMYDASTTPYLIYNTSGLPGAANSRFLADATKIGSDSLVQADTNSNNEATLTLAQPLVDAITSGSDFTIYFRSVSGRATVLMQEGEGLIPGIGGSSAHLVADYTAAPVPEPASMAALGLGVAALLRRRRK